MKVTLLRAQKIRGRQHLAGDTAEVSAHEEFRMAREGIIEPSSLASKEAASVRGIPGTRSIERRIIA